MSEIYRKVRVLGSGSIATVYEGWDEHLRRGVAIKELSPAVAADRELVSQFLEGAGRMAEISHPNVLAVHHVDQTHATPWLILELADGGTLQEAARAGRMPPERTVSILGQLLLGLGEVHRRGIVHRQVQPDNVFVCKGSYKLGDFGLPQAIRNGSLSTFASKLSKYRSPEELGQTGVPAAASDLYSLGLLVYELLVGEARLRKEVEKQVRREGAAASPAEEEGRLWFEYHLGPAELPPANALVPAVPEPLAAILQRMMHKDPADRYASCGLVAADLERAAGGKTEPPPPREYAATELLPGVPDGQRRRRLWRNSALALAALLAAAAGAFVWRTKAATVEDIAVVAEPPVVEQAAAAALPDAASVAAALAPLTTAGESLEIAAILDGETVASVPINESFALRVRSDSAAQGTLFILSPDGTIYRLYPNSSRPLPLAIPARLPLDLPLAEDRANGFDLVASEPAGRHVAYLLSTEESTPPVPYGEVLNAWMTLYPLRSGERSPAAELVRWVEDVRRAQPETARLVSLELDVTR